jgi:hypothetical protein
MKGGEVIEYTVKVFGNGNRYWYLNGQLHREDGAAIEYANGSRCWWLNGKCHREDGPAIEYADGTRYWYLGGVKYTEEEFNKKTAKVKELTVAEIESLLGYQIKVVK